MAEEWQIFCSLLISTTQIYAHLAASKLHGAVNRIGLELAVREGNGHYKFNVQGRLWAIGTQQDSIRFTAENTETGWYGIRFESTPITNDTSRIVICRTS